MNNKNKKPIIFIVLLFTVLLIVGGTIAYYTSTDTFSNEFETGIYQIQVQENFISPDDWTPGTTTPKEVIATNKGNVDVAVRVKLTENWIDANGDPLPLRDSNYRYAAIINLANDNRWKYNYSDGYYYYNYYLKPNESTTSLIKSVTFNPNVNISQDKNCETVNGITTCATSLGGYSGGKYTLTVDIETCQYDEYRNIWNVDQTIREHVDCLMVHNSNSSTTFGKEIYRNTFESITTVENKNIPNNAIDSWDVSNDNNGSVMAWYTDADNNGMYELYIGQNGGVIANYDSSYAFSNFTKAESINLTNYNTKYVESMTRMFNYFGYDASSVNLDLRGFNTSNVTTTTYMFVEAGHNANSFVVNVTGWDTKNVSRADYTFSQSGYEASTYEIIGLNDWNTENMTNMKAMFSYAGRNATTWSIGNLSNWDTRKATTMVGMFNVAGTNATTWNDIGTLKIYTNNMSQIFLSCGSAKATLNIYSNPDSYGYYEAFSGSAINTGSGITVNYSSAVTNIDSIIATKSNNSNVVKGTQLD